MLLLMVGVVELGAQQAGCPCGQAMTTYGKLQCQPQS